MAYNKIIVSAKLVGALYGGKSIYNKTNRGFDSEIQQGYDFVDIPMMGGLVVRGTGVAYNHVDRKEFRANTDLVRVDIVKRIIPLAESLEARFNKAGFLDAYTSDAQRALGQDFDSLVIAEAQTTTQKIELIGAAFDLPDMVDMKKKFDDAKVPDTPGDRVLVFPSSYQDKLWAIPIIQQAAAFNKEALETGVYVKLFGFTIFVSALVEKVNAKANMVAWYAPGLAFLLAPFMDRGEVYSSEDGGRLIDLISFCGRKLYDSKYAVVKYLE
jgi:hypothetical protein